MEIVIIGNSVAGQTAAETILREKADDSDIYITIITREPHPYYSRIFLPHYIADERTKQQLYIRNADWYQKHGVSLLLGEEVERVDAADHMIYLKNNDLTLSYDKLVIAVGSHPRKIDFGKPDISGVFTLRTIQDADEIKDYIAKNNVKKAFIVGGGLLGIELGYHVKDLGIEVTICEIESHLLPRQLCARSSQYLLDYLREQGLHFVLGESVSEFIGDDAINGVKAESGKKIKTDVVFEQLGIIPNIEMAKRSDLETGRGIIVNEYMQTSEPDIYAAGDCIQFKDQIWGIIPASLDQAKIAAKHIIGNETEPYKSTVWHTRLKIAGINLISVGEPKPEDKDVAEVLWSVDEESHSCRKIIVENNKMTGAILMGDKAKNSRFFIQNVGHQVSVDEIKKHLDN